MKKGVVSIMDCQDLRASIVERKIEEPNINVAYPEVVGLLPPNKNVRYKGVPEKINQAIQKLVRQMMLEMGATNPDLAEMEGTYKVTLNQNGVLSIRFENFSFIEMAAHPWTIMRALTFNLKTGNTVDIASLFKVGSGYRLIISNEIKRQIKARDIPLIAEFTRINDDQEYYLTDKALVVFFQRATIAPSVAGILEFPIPYSMLTNVISQEGILAPVVWCK